MASRHNSIKNNKENLEKRINIRLTEEQYSELESEMAAQGFTSLPKYVRAVLKKKNGGNSEPSAYDRQYIKTLSQALKELQKMSQNTANVTFAIRRILPLKDKDGNPLATPESLTRGLDALEKLLENSNGICAKMTNKINDFTDGCEDPETR